ncbi:MAG: hypothetical protein LBK67_11880 [Coriobacteriales bacterium]|jgi:formate-dependent nitrite reductase membrane component NrfD|nr:hypothetical protein [Coriobacteriales bacterium]
MMRGKAALVGPAVVFLVTLLIAFIVSFIIVRPIVNSMAQASTFDASSTFLYWYFWMFALPLCVVLACLWHMIFTRKSKLEAISLVAAISLGLFHMFFTIAMLCQITQ